jgi:hypothetical protein
MAINFVAISGISDSDQLKKIKNICLEEKITFPVCIGYQLSNKSINQGTQNPRQPKFLDLADLDKQTRRDGFMTALHYYTRDNNTILEDVQKIIASGINPSSLIQFNSLPPSPNILEQVKKLGFKIILPVAVSHKSSPENGYKVWKGEEVEDVLTGNPDSLYKQIYERRDFIDYAMFDPSHGKKLELNLEENSLAIKFGKKIIENSELDNLGLIYAGGITPINVKRITNQLRSFFPERFSIDIEGGARIDNKLDLKLVRDYLKGYRDSQNNSQTPN